MTTKLNRKAVALSSITISVVFKEVSEDGAINQFITPNEGLSWTLKNESGEIVNNRVNVPLIPGITVAVTLMGQDLALASDYPEYRILLIEGTYDGFGGDNLPLRDAVFFQVVNP